MSSKTAVTVRLSEEVLAKLRQVCKRKKWTLSFLVNALLEEAIKHQEKKHGSIT